MSSNWNSRREYRQSLRDQRRQQGLCIHCPEEVAPGHAMCQRHLEYSRQRRKSKKQLKQCNNCSKPPLPGRSRCESCYARAMQRMSEEYQSRKQRGLCVQCGEAAAVSGKSGCRQCLDNTAGRNRAKKERRIARGLCTHCGKQPPLSGQSCCESCFFKALSHDHFDTRAEAEFLKELFIKQMGRCAYSGLPLSLGRDATIDHIIPVSRGGSHGPENVQWVHASINQMKFSFSEAEFLALVKAVYLHRVS